MIYHIHIFNLRQLKNKQKKKKKRKNETPQFKGPLSQMSNLRYKIRSYIEQLSGTDRLLMNKESFSYLVWRSAQPTDPAPYFILLYIFTNKI